MYSMQNPNLSDEQKAVLFDKATESPYRGKWLYHDNEGGYVCANCGTTLFNSNTKYDSHCGWPSFGAALPDSVEFHTDNSFGMKRVEVTCAKCGGHLGHVFPDGTVKTTGQQFCINSLALDFKPKE